MLDPLDIFLGNTCTNRGLTPVPLVSTDHEVELRAGLAVVTTRRLFRNIEPGPIEAALTFPLPVHATLFELTADIDGRRLHAAAQDRLAARRVYEDAIERGRSAVLHEELLRGIHMISVANLRAGGVIAITTRWAMPLTVTAGRARLRIPQTVGQVYGRAPLADADALATGGAAQPVMVTVRAPSQVEVVGATLASGHARVSSAVPIDIIAELWAPAPLIGPCGDGRSVALTLTPEPAGDGPLSLAVLVDRSGSMAGGAAGRTAHEAAKQAIVALASRLDAGDVVDLWEFDNHPRRIGSTGGPDVGAADNRFGLMKLAMALTPPSGGTEIGRAIDVVLAQSATRDVLVLTDGLSHALDVQRLARGGRRISVVLIGEASLDAMIGHLAAQTGGDLFIATAADLQGVAGAAIDSLRRRHQALPSLTQRPDWLEGLRNNVRMTAQWRPGAAASSEIARAAAAVATNLLVGCAPPDIARAAAVAAGIVSHLTSLVLVDEAGAIQEAMPAFRKVLLAEPSSMAMAFSAVADPPAYACALPSFELPTASRSREGAVSSPPRRQPLSASEAAERVRRNVPAGAPPLPELTVTLMTLAYQVDWGQQREALVRGDLSAVPDALCAAVVDLAAMPGIRAFADRHGLPPAAIAFGLMARAIAQSDGDAKAVWLAIVSRLRADGPRFWMLEEQLVPQAGQSFKQPSMRSPFDLADAMRGARHP